MPKKNFVSSIFDFTFTELVTTRFVQFLYALSLAVDVGLSLVVVAAAFGIDMTLGIVALIVSPFLFLLLALISRIYAEMLIVAFRIAENTSRLVELGAPQPAAAVSHP